MRKIVAAISFLTPEREVRLRSAAQKLGFEIAFVRPDALTESDIADCEVLFGMVRPPMLRAAESLKWFQCSFAGVDRFCDEDLFAAPVVMTNASGAYGITISEHMIAALLMLMRLMPAYVDLQKECGWRVLGEVRSIYGSLITVVGTGDIGANFARRAQAMGARVRGVRRTNRAVSGFDELFTADRLEEALAGADVVALCVPETDETRALLSAERLARLKHGAIVMNVGRGSAIDQLALCEALNAGRLGGAAIDVTEPEPLPPGHPLWTAKNCFITPHVSGNMSLGLTCELVIEIFLENLENYAAGRPLRNVVDRARGY